MEGHYQSCTDPANCWCDVKRYGNVIALGVLIFAIEFVGSLEVFSGSLSLQADAWHVVICNSMYASAAIAAAMVKFCLASHEKAEMGAVLVLALGLLAVVGIIIFEALGRLANPPEVTSSIMILVAAVGGLLNWRQQHMHHGAADEHKGHVHGFAAVHIAGDKWQSWGVVAGGLFKLGWEQTWPNSWVQAYIDPILSLLIALFLAVQLVLLCKDYLEEHGNGKHEREEH